MTNFSEDLLVPPLLVMKIITTIANLQEQTMEFEQKI
jgi:hypothetical protein